MLGITIGTGEYYSRLAKRAARAVEEKTGVKTIVLGDEHFAASGLPAPHHLKLRLFDFVDDDFVMYFDADMVCLNSWKPERVARKDAVVAVAADVVVQESLTKTSRLRDIQGVLSLSLVSEGVE